MSGKIGKYTFRSHRTHYVPKYWVESEAAFPLSYCEIGIIRETLQEGEPNCPECRRWKSLFSQEPETVFVRLMC